MSQPNTNVLVNGQAENCLDVFDRGLHYGDGVFETIAVKQGTCLRLEQHLQRLTLGCERLAIPVPDMAKLQAECHQLAGNNAKSVLKIIVTRGAGGRGYKIPTTQQTTRIVMLNPWPDYPEALGQTGIKLYRCETQLACQPKLAGIKHLNRLENILARNEWQDADIYEGVMCDRDGNVIEGTMSNLFMIKNGEVHTPDLSVCGVAGVMRQTIIELLEKASVKVYIGRYTIDDLLAAEELFVSNSLIGLWPVKQFMQQTYTIGPVSQDMMRKLV